MWNPGVAAVIAAAMISTGAVAAVTMTVVDIPSLGATQRILYLHPDAPTINPIAVPGGDGVFGIQSDGTMYTATGRCNPVARNRDTYANHGYAVALVDEASDHSTYNFEDLREVVRYMRTRNNVPTWLIGGSNSTAVIANLAIDLPGEDPAGTIFFSPQILDRPTAAAIK